MAAKKKWLKGIMWTAVGGLALFVMLMAGLQFVLSPKMCTSLIQKYYPEFIDGKLSIKEAYVSVFSHFPAVTLYMDEFIVTYPSLYSGDKSDFKKVKNFMELAGSSRVPADSTCTAERMDTLCSFEKLSVSINVLSLINGNIRVKNLEFQKPRAFIHIYPDSTSNFDRIKLPAFGESSDSSTYVIQDILVKKLFIGSRSYVVYTDRRNDMYSMLFVQRIDFEGKISALDPLANKFSLGMDTVYVSGSYNKDTLLFGLNHLEMENHQDRLDFDATATAYAATRAFGRVQLPLHSAGSLRIYDVRHHAFRASLSDFAFDCATVHAQGEMDAEIADTIRLNGHVEFPSVDVQEFTSRLSERFVPDLALFITDAKVRARADVDGYYVSGMKGLPGMKISLDVPFSHAGIVGADFIPEFELHATADVKQSAEVDLNVSKFMLKGPGLDCNLNGKVKDILGQDPKVFVDLGMSASLKEMLDKFGKYIGMTGTGNVSAVAKGSFNFSNLNIYEIGGAEIDSQVDVNGMNLSSLDDSLHVYCNNLSLTVGKETTKRSKKPLFAAKACADSLLCLIKGTMHIHGRGVEAMASAMPRVINVSEKMSYFPLVLSLNMDRFFVQDMDSNSFKIKFTKNFATVHPVKGKTTTPVVKLKSSSDKIRFNMGPHRLSFTGLSLNASARLADNDGRKRRIQAFKDSLLKRHPDWNDDSLAANFKKKAMARQTPEWLSESDFKKNDFQFSLSSSSLEFFKTWDFNGNLDLTRARVSTPAFPLKTSVTAFKASIDNNNVILDTLRIVAGSSDVAASGKITHLRRAFLRNGTPELTLDVCSDTIAFNEFMGALAKGQANMEKDLSALAAMSDEKYDSFVEEKQKENIAETAPSLVVVPANLDADIKIRGRKMRYSTLDIQSFSADLLMKRRCLQAKNITAKSNAGNVYLEAFYSSLTKQKLTTGFDLTLSDVSAAQIISLIPDVDSLMPLLKTFDGNLNCNIAATSSLDTNMNILLPTLNGIIRISGTNLHFNNDKQVEKLMRRLLFRKPKEAKVDSMMVEGILKDSKLEIFPFILKMDRWTVSIAGIQNLDKTFSYHASLIKSPLIIKLGATLYGEDFDHINFKIGKPHFRKESAIPSFSTAIDTTRFNLVQSIRTIFDRGVDAALKENSRHLDMEHERAEKNYVQSASLDKLEELSGRDKALADSLSVTN